MPDPQSFFRTLLGEAPRPVAQVPAGPPLRPAPPPAERNWLDRGVDALLGGIGVKDPLAPNASRATTLGGVVAAGVPLLGGAKAIKNAATTAAKARTGIRAYHGSPHDFNKFDSTRIGTGEGGQSYGYGLYFAGKEDVARSYRDALAQPTVSIMGQLQDVPSWSADLSPQPRLIRHLADARGNLGPDVPEDRVIESVRQRLLADYASAGTDDVARNHVASQLDILRAAEERGLTTNLGGKMYEVNLDVEPGQLLDLDRPFQHQSPTIQSRTERWAQRPAVYDGMPLAGGGELVIRDDKYFLQTGGKRFGLSPADVERLIGRTGTGGSIYQNLVGDLRSPRRASEALQEMGVPGLHYLDQGSRVSGTAQGLIHSTGSQEAALALAQQRLQQASFGDLRYWQGLVDELSKPQTRNTVMFPGTDDLIAILRKYGILAPLAGGAAYAGSQPQVGSPPPVQAPRY